MSLLFSSSRYKFYICTVKQSKAIKMASNQDLMRELLEEEKKHKYVSKLETKTNPFGEEFTKWQSHKHPDNPSFMQIVYWRVWVKKDGSTLVAYSLGYDSKAKYIYDLTKEEAIAKYAEL